MYKIYKKNVLYTLKKKPSLKGGYTFNKATKITIYNKEITKYVINQKIKKSINNILKLLLTSEDEDSSQNIIEIKIETLRMLLLTNYKPYLEEEEINKHLKKLDKIHKKIYKNYKTL